jgi:hypothetical protein
MNTEARTSLKNKRGKRNLVIKKEGHKKFQDYTFMDNNIELKKMCSENVNNSSSSSSSLFGKKYKKGYVGAQAEEQCQEGQEVRRQAKVSGKSQHSSTSTYLPIILLGVLLDS